MKLKRFHTHVWKNKNFEIKCRNDITTTDARAWTLLHKSDSQLNKAVKDDACIDKVVNDKLEQKLKEKEKEILLLENVKDLEKHFSSNEENTAKKTLCHISSLKIISQTSSVHLSDMSSTH